MAERLLESYQDSSLERSSLFGCHGSSIYFGQHSIFLRCDKRGDYSIEAGGCKYLLRKGLRDWRSSVCTQRFDLPQCIRKFDRCPDRSVSSASRVRKVYLLQDLVWVSRKLWLTSFLDKEFSHGLIFGPLRNHSELLWAHMS